MRGKYLHLRPALLGVVAIGAVFAAVVATLLLVDAIRFQEADPVHNKAFKTLKLQLAETPKNVALQQAIRDMDLLFRGRVFDHQAQGNLAATLLLADAIIIMIALALLRTFRPPKPVEPNLQAATATWAPAPALLGLAVAAAFSCVALIISSRSLNSTAPPAISTGSSGDGNTTAEPAAPAINLANAVPSPWPAFRGPAGRSIVSKPTCPLTIGADNRLWRCALPKPGYASPVISGDVIGMLCGDNDGVLLLGINATDGTIRWQVDMPARPGDDFPEPQDSGWVASSPVCDSAVIAATCANGTVIGVSSADGTVLWMKQPGAPILNYGYGSSLMIHKTTVFLQRDCDEEAELIAYDLHSGKELWTTIRDGMPSWASPVLTDSEPPLLVCAGEPDAVAYELTTGEEVWRTEVVHGELGPSPAAAFGKVVTCQEGSAIVYLNASDGAELWRREDLDLPDVCTPLLTEKHIYIAQSWGLLQCLDAETGEKKWENYDVGGMQATPLLIGDQIMLLNDKGDLIIIADSADGYQEISRSSLNEACVASPMIVDDRLYLRSEKALHCFAKASP